MKLVTRTAKAQRVALSARRMLTAWERHSSARERRRESYHQMDVEIVALGDSPSPSDIDRISGLNLTTITCDSCGARCDEAVELPARDGTQRICRACIEAAAALLPPACEQQTNSV